MAVEILKRVRAQEHKAPAPKADVLTVQAARDAYEKHATHDTLAADKSRAVHLTAYWGSKKASDVNQASVDAYLAKRRLERSDRRKALPSPQTLHHEVSLLRRVLRYAVRSDLLDSNPFDKVKLPSFTLGGHPKAANGGHLKSGQRK